MPDDCTLTQLDNTLRMFVTFCAAYHGALSSSVLSFVKPRCDNRHMPTKPLLIPTDEYLSSAQEMYQAIELLLESELYTFHYERMVALMMADALEVRCLSTPPSHRADDQNTNPHELYILYHIVLYYGQRHPALFRSHRKWRKLLPTLGEVVAVEVDEVGSLA